MRWLPQDQYDQGWYGMNNYTVDPNGNSSTSVVTSSIMYLNPDITDPLMLIHWVEHEEAQFLFGRLLVLRSERNHHVGRHVGLGRVGAAITWRRGHLFFAILLRLWRALLLR